MRGHLAGAGGGIVGPGQGGHHDVAGGQTKGEAQGKIPVVGEENVLVRDSGAKAAPTWAAS